MLVLRSSMFALTQICYPKCFNSSKQPQCFETCVEDFVASRNWLKENFFQRVEQVQKENERVLNSFYK